MNTGVNSPSGITIKSPRELDLMREAGKVVASAKQAVKDAIRPGVTSMEMDAVAEEVIRNMVLYLLLKVINRHLVSLFLPQYVSLSTKK